MQLPVWINNGEVDPRNWPVLRHAQELAWRRTRHTGMACIIDCGEYDNIHPTDKRTVGERLYQVAKPVVYGLPGESSIYATGKYPVEGGLLITLSGKVQVKGDALAFFEVAGPDGQYRKAEAQVRQDSILLTCEAVPFPCKARYAHINYTTVNLFGENGLPLAPFVLE